MVFVLGGGIVKLVDSVGGHDAICLLKVLIQSRRQIKCTGMLLDLSQIRSTVGILSVALSQCVSDT